MCYGTYNSIGSNISGTEYDVAHVKWGENWRMPTETEIQELCDRCTWTWTTFNGVNGYEVVGPNGNSIFLPAAGYRISTDVYARGENSNYWSAVLDDEDDDDDDWENDDCYAYTLGFYHDDSNDHDDYWKSYGEREFGLPVRPVTE